MANNLSQLQEIEVTNCKKLQDIICKESEEQVHQNERISRIEFTQLRTLTLQSLPWLTDFSFKAFTSDIGSHEILVEDEHGVFMSFISQKVSFPCLEELELCELPELLHLWKENSQPSKVFENLSCPKVAGYGNLKTLVPSSVSLQNLTMLEVQKCDGLINFVTFSTAKSLKQLKIMNIIDCKIMEEILVGIGDEVKDVIVFNQLKYLKLSRFTIEFPYLQRVLVIRSQSG
ncbi:hypothetical protein EZV62_024598 [Acer yangbiense]|uniref:Disease resistance protein At4g27190-like leucine-rich repeats domain-containing protein n=1 Tax=Acer yangbiense TaxID=1000413 RepID=A0A5C7GVJ3_9ROSI|nr:hypothetical protein EZV62_024598 [Acer yangbiense]